MITKITPEQKAQIPVYIKKWVDLASKPIDRSRVKEIIKKVYGEDKLVIMGESLQNTIDLIKLATKGKKLKISQLYGQLDSQLDSQLYGQLDSQLDYYVSYFWYDLAGYYDYGKYIGVKFDEDKLNQYIDILLNMPICIFLGNVIFLTEKPKCLWNNNGFLHSDTKPAIYWQDGTGIYFLNGVKFPQDLWEKAVNKKLSFKEVVEIEDIDQRTQAMAYCPPQEFLKENGKLLDKSKRGNELWFIPQGLFRIGAYFLLYKDPSTNKEYMSGIDPKIGLSKNADEAQAWKHNITISEYNNLRVET